MSLVWDLGSGTECSAEECLCLRNTFPVLDLQANIKGVQIINQVKQLHSFNRNDIQVKTSHVHSV